MFSFSKVLKKKKLSAKIYEYEKTNNYDKIIRTSIKLEKYSSQKERGELYFNIAENIKKSYQLNKKSYSIDLALDYLTKALDCFPSDKTKISNSIVACYYLVKDYDKVAEYLKISLRENPMQPTLYSNLFSLGISNFSLKERKNFLDEMLLKFPLNAYLHYYKGKEFHISNKINSIYHYKKAVELNPNEEYFYKNLIDVLITSREFGEALQYLKLLECRFINSYSTFDKLGDFYRIRSDYYSLNDAKNNYIKAIQTYPSGTYIYIKLSEICTELYEFENAIKYLEIARNDLNYPSPKRGEIFFSLAVLNNLISNTVAAIENYQQAARLDIKYLLNPYIKEIFDCNILRMKNILKHNSKNKPVLYSLASRFYDFKNYKAAMNYFGLLYHLDPHYKDVEVKASESMKRYVDEVIVETDVFIHDS